MLKKLFFPLVALFMLAGCATPPTTIDVSPKITLPQQDPSLMGVTVSINGADQRQDQALAKMKAGGVQFHDIDKTVFIKATEPVRAQYGDKHQDLMKAIADVQ